MEIHYSSQSQRKTSLVFQLQKIFFSSIVPPSHTRLFEEIFMASPTKKVKVRRIMSKARAGKARKNNDANYGSTAKRLPLTMPNANESAQIASRK